MNGNKRIAVLLDAESAFDRQLLQGIGQYSRRHGPWSFRLVGKVFERLKPPAGLWGVSGVIGRVHSEQILGIFKRAGIPVVAVEGISSSPERPTERLLAKTFLDMNAIARMAAEHFRKQGFERMAFVGSPHRDWPRLTTEDFEFSRIRIDQPIFMFPEAGRSEKLCLSSLRKWLERLPKPVGIVAPDDTRGLQILEACHHTQIKVPSEVAVLGVGNDELLCSLSNPSLSSVALSAVDGGFRAARALDRLLQGTTALPEQLLIRPHGLVARSSTDAVVSRDPHVSAARSIIHGRCTQHFSISALAKSVGVSRRTLELKFRKHIGRTVFDEIQDARLAKAKVILKETELPISRVAVSTGYSSVAYFIRVFGKETGLTPAKYRAAARVTEVRHNGNRGIWKLAE